MEEAVSKNRKMHSPLQTLSTNHVLFSVTLSHGYPVLNLTGSRAIYTDMICLRSRKRTNRAKRAGRAHCTVPGQHLLTRRWFWVNLIINIVLWLYFFLFMLFSPTYLTYLWNAETISLRACTPYTVTVVITFYTYFAFDLSTVYINVENQLKKKQKG